MERAFEYIEVSLPRVYNCSLILKTEERSLSKAMSTIDVKHGTMSLRGPPCLIRDYLWSKFQQNRVIFVGEKVQTTRNPPKETTFLGCYIEHKKISKFIT